MNAGISIGKALQQGRLRLAACSETPGLDAQRLLVSVTGRPRAWLLSHLEAALDRQQEQSFRQGLERLLEGEALAYVLGEWPFYGRDFAISPHVLIPRPETELLVEAALDYLRVHPSRRLAADIGAGSGCIGVSLAAEVPGLIVVATEISPV
ncbi:MAG TPA: peptide chain release factor N(5)-glutamine methyltransferase, partial [Chloroflexi bacterium]|nr:peptide chain release factor N(5)-glutamine methyltransferase [Chloroflexota bacterium]